MKKDRSHISAVRSAIRASSGRRLPPPRATRRENPGLEVTERPTEELRERTATLERENQRLLREIAEYQLAERSLRAGEQNYRRLLEHARDGIWVIDSNGCTSYANPRMAEILGCAPEEMPGKQIYGFLDAQDGRAARRYLESGRAGAEHNRGFEFVKTDGTRVLTHLSTSPIVDDEGTLVGAIAWVEDVTEQRSVEAALSLSEARFREIYENAPVMMHSINEEGVILNVNRKWQEVLGYSRHEAVGQGLDLIMTEESARRAFSFILPQYWEKGDVDDVAYQYVKKDRTVIDVLLDSRVMIDPVWGKISLSVIRDVTDAKQAQEALRRSEERFRAVFEGARDAIFIKDRNLRYTHANSAALKLLKLTESEVLGKTADDFLEEDTAKIVKQADIRVLGGESIEREFTARIKGVTYAFHEIKGPLKNDAGEIVGICGVSRDITDRKKAGPSTNIFREDCPSEAMRAAFAQARFGAATDTIVLLQGESGSGKDYLARWIHHHSRRANGPFFAINCAAVHHELAESELFGHEAGSFTGARGRKRGLLELAEGGTILLNEIGELPLTLQSKLLTFLDTRTFLRVGGERAIKVNARLMAATHRDLVREVEEGRFLPALFYRLNVFSVEVPPLRQRIEDVPLLAEQMMEELSAEMQLDEIPEIDAAAMKALMSYHWPGNVRELRNVLERAVMVSTAGRLHLMLPESASPDPGWSCEVAFPEACTLHEVTGQVVRSLCEEALRRSYGNKQAAARLLGISRYTFYRYIKGLGIECGTETHT